MNQKYNMDNLDPEVKALSESASQQIKAMN